MIPLGLRAPERREFHRELVGSHSIRVVVQVLDLEHNMLTTLGDELVDGQVNIDADGEVTRSATVTFLDRRRSYDFDSDSPANGALYANRLLRIRYGVRVPALGDWVDVPLFTGPVTKLDRAGDEVTVEAQGKEILAQGAGWAPMRIKKGTPKTDAITRIMRERGGEHRFDFPDLGSRLPKGISLGRQSVPWDVAQKIARSMNRQLYYDGRGVCKLRRFPANVVFTFNDGTNGEIVTPPQVSFSMDDVRNAVWVKGGTPKRKKSDKDTPQDGDKKQKERGVAHFETAPRSHPLSPWRLGRWDTPRYLLEVIENDAIRSEKEARETAQRVLRKRLRQLVDVTFDSLPIPHLEPEDLIAVNADGLGMVVRLGQCSIPLKHDQVMSVGYLAKRSVSRRKRNRP